MLFYSDNILAKQGPLAQVWLAAHWERKLTKANFLQTNITHSVGAILETGDEGTLALRLSGQLLLGVVRIYSRKAKYLLEDCNEALIKVKMAFRPGVVDLTDEQAVASLNSITLGDAITEFDILLPEPTLDLSLVHPHGLEMPLSQNISRPQDITMADLTQTGLLDARTMDRLDVLEDMSQQGVGASNAWDLNLDDSFQLDLEAPEVPDMMQEPSMEVEVGRDAGVEQPFSPIQGRDSLASFELEKQPEDPLAQDRSQDFSFEALEPMPDAPLEAAQDSLMQEMPDPLLVDRSMYEDQENQAPEEESAPRKKKTSRAKPQRKRKRVFDEHIELSAADMKSNLTNTKDLLKQIVYIPGTRQFMQSMHRYHQGAEYYLNEKRWHDHFSKDVQFLFHWKSSDSHGERKRRITAASVEPVEPVEYEQPDVTLDVPVPESEPVYDVTLNDATLNESILDGAHEDLPAPDAYDGIVHDSYDFIQEELIEPHESIQKSMAAAADIFDFDQEPSSQDVNDQGFSSSTVNTMKTFHQAFQQTSEFTLQSKVSTRADAVKMFFEVLVLKTKDLIQVEQKEAYGDVKIQRKADLSLLCM